MTQQDLFAAPVMTEEQESVYRHIAPRKGKAAAISAPELTDMTGIPDRRARAVVKELVEEIGLPIASCPSGFFIPVTEEEVAAARRQYVSWALSLLQRASRFGNSSRIKEICGQLRLEVAG